MYTNTYLPNVAYAKQELVRLHAIRANLANNIIDLKANCKGQKSAETWVKIYQGRLKEDVLPAIKECEQYIKSRA